MLRTYKHNGKMWRYEEGEQPAGAMLVEASTKKGEAAEERAEKAVAKRRAQKKDE